MTQFRWHIDGNNYLSAGSGQYGDNMPARQFITVICKKLDWYSINYSLEELKSGSIRHCHAHDKSKVPENPSEEYKSLFRQLVKINTRLGQNETPTQLDETDIMQLCLDDVKKGYRCFGYVMNDVFHLIYLDPYHKVYEA
jgi:hypothetical protein